MRLEGKVALITGAGSGMGRAMSLLFAKEGANIAVNDVNLGPAEETTAMVKKLGRKAITVQADVSMEKEVVNMVSRTIKELGGVNILVNNAGISIGGPALEMTVETFDRIQAVFLRGCFMCSREAGRWMSKQKGGKIVNISSIAAFRFRTNMLAYATAKAGIVNLTRALALEWAPYHINVNCIIPGGINTPMSRAHVSTMGPEKIKELIPWGRIGEVEDIARAALFLVSDDADFITGVFLPVDGGELVRY